MPACAAFVLPASWSTAAWTPRHNAYWPSTTQRAALCCASSTPLASCLQACGTEPWWFMEEVAGVRSLQGCFVSGPLAVASVAALSVRSVGWEVKCTIVPRCFFFFLLNLALEECGKTWQRMKSRLIQKGKNVFVTTFSKYYFRKRVVTVNEACLCYCVRIPAFTLRSYQFSTTTIRQAGCNHVTITYISNADMRLIQCLLPFDFC